MKRTPMKRTAFKSKPLKDSGPAVSTKKLVKCKAPGCQGRFIKLSMDHHACSQPCAMAVIAVDKAKKEVRTQAEDRRQTRAQLEALKTRTDHLKEAQIAFNRYVRLRDAGRPCICCGRPLDSGSGVGGGYDAGHYRSVGSAPHLRFEEDNCHGQTKQCNRYGSGRAVDYRLGLIQRIGLARVEALEADQAPRKLDKADLIAIRDRFKARAREIEKGMKSCGK